MTGGSSEFCMMPLYRVKSYEPSEVTRSIATPPGWDASPSQVTSLTVCWYPFTPGWREAL